VDASAGDEAGNLLAAVLRAVVPKGGQGGQGGQGGRGRRARRGEGGNGGRGEGCRPPRPVVLLGATATATAGPGPGPGPGSGPGHGSLSMERPGGVGSRTDAGAVLDQLTERLVRVTGGLRACVRISAESMRRDYGVRPLTLAIGAAFARGGHEGGGGGGARSQARTAGLPLPDFWLMRDVTELALTEASFASDPRRLRDHCYASRVGRSPALRALRALGGVNREGKRGRPGRRGLVLRKSLGPLVYDLPRWWWARRCDRRFMRPDSWYARWPGSAGAGPSDGFFDSVGRLVKSRQVGTHRSVRTREILRAVAAEAYEELLLRALLADLRAASTARWCSPWRRVGRGAKAGRRGAGTVRFALLLELPRAGGDLWHSPGALFLRKYRAAALATGCPALAVIGAGPPGSAGDCPDAVTELADATRQVEATAAVPSGESGLPVLYARLPGRLRVEGAGTPRTWRMAADR
jgi:hypothetical protein